MIIEYVFSGLTFLAILLLICLFHKYARSRNPKGQDSVYAVLWWLSTFILGFALFFRGAIYKQQVGVDNFNYLSAIANSITSAMRMFAFEYNDSLVKALSNDNVVFRVAIIACFILAGIWTQVMITRLFLGGLVNGVKVFLHSHGFFRRKHTHYIVIGCGKKAEVFLENLEKENSRWDITIITGEPIGGTGKINDDYKSLIAKGFTLINGKADKVALENAGINNTKRHTIIIALTESDEQNIAIADIVTRKIFSFIFQDKKYEDIEFQKKVIKALQTNKVEDPELRALRDKVEKALKTILLEAYIMYTFIERTEHFSFAENAYGKVDFFNPYELRARRFFWEHPITDSIRDLLDIKKARLRGDLNADGLILKPDTRPQRPYMIKNIFIGFGLANFQMLKGSVMTGQLQGCDYNAVIFDENIQRSDDADTDPAIYQSMFINQAPGLFGHYQEMDGFDYFESPKEKYNIEFKRGNTLKREFYKSVLEEIRGNDFTSVYIALGNDKVSVETACELRQTLCESGILLSTIRIYVKFREKTAIIDDAVINNVRNIPLKIKFFGAENEVLTKEEIISEEINCLAQAISNKEHETPWGYLSEFERDSNRRKVLEIKTMLGFLGFGIEKEACDPGIEEQYEKKYGLNDTVREIIDNAKTDKSIRLQYIEINKDDGSISDTARNNLAQREHLRWNTFHLVNGWTKKPKRLTGGKNGSDDLLDYFELSLNSSKLGRKNLLTKQHACITTFEGLRELRCWQKREAEKAGKCNYNEGDFDTVYHDFTLLDGLVVRLGEARKNRATKWSIVKLEEPKKT
jgi:hypothetical protein